MTCPKFLGSVFPASHYGTTIRGAFGMDPRGTSFWLQGNGSSPSTSFAEEYSLKDLSLLQRFDFTEPTADFWGGDGTGGVTYLTGTAIKRRDAGGTVTSLYTIPTPDIGAIFVGQDAANDRLIHLRRTNTSAPFLFNVVAIEMNATVTTLATGVTFGAYRPIDYPTVSPPHPYRGSYVWMAVAQTTGPRTQAAWGSLYNALGSNLTTANPISPVIPRPSVPNDPSGEYIRAWVDVGSGPIAYDEDFDSYPVGCPDLSAVTNCTTHGIGIDKKHQVVLAVNAGGSGTQWDIWLLYPPGGWGRRRSGGAGF